MLSFLLSNKKGNMYYTCVCVHLCVEYLENGQLEATWKEELFE